MRSLDALIGYLLEEVALCGKQGAGQSEVWKHVNAFYANPSGLDGNQTVQDDGDKSTDAVVIDRQFQEQVWKWLVSHPECRTGTHRQDGRPSLSKVKTTNHARLHHQTVAEPILRKGDGSPSASPPSEAQEDRNRRSSVIPESINDSAQSHSINEQAGLPQSPRSAQLGPSKPCVDRSPEADGEVRVYVNEERMWHALTGHGVDHSRIPPLDFVCLSIIAAAGPQGIIQPELVKISDQDNRSLPKRTQALFEKGYITKTPIVLGSIRTSICTLRRFITVPNAQKLETDDTREEPGLDLDSPGVFRQCFSNGGANLYLLLRHIFDLLNRFKIITLEDLRRKLGVIGHRWERRLLASTLRKLDAVGCAKQVRAQAHSLGDSSKYFRCLKLIREPSVNESQFLCGVSHVDLRSVSIDRTGASDSESEADEDDQALEASGPVRTGNSAPGTNLEELRRPIPQWTGSGCISNHLYDMIQRAGTLGLSSMDVKHQAFGRFVARPIENQLTRIVERWQISQPAHLRHLAIIRDTAMGKKSAHYIHYTYDNFKRLVDNGDASWEAVSILGSHGQNTQQPAFPVDANTDLDEYGFPNIPPTMFQGRHNDATVSQCVDAVELARAPVNKHDPVVKELSDGTYEVHHALISQPKSSRKPAVIGKSTKESTKALKTPRPRGRPRKVPRTELPKGLTRAQKAKYVQSQKAAINYQKGKIEKEIARRLGAGEDPNQVREEIFATASAMYLDAGEEIPTSIKEVRVHDMMLSGISAPPIFPPVKLSVGKKRSRENPPAGSERTVPNYLPSVAAHTQTVYMNLETASDRNNCSSTQGSTRLLKKVISRKDKEKAALVSKPNRSTGMTYHEQSNLIGRTGRGVFVGVDALPPRTPGQRGRRRKCRLAIFKSARLSDIAWFNENPITLENRGSTPVGDEARSRPGVLSPSCPVSVRPTREQMSPPGVESPKPSRAGTGRANTLNPSQTAPSSALDDLLTNGSTDLNVSDQVRMSDHAAYTDSNAEFCIETNTFAAVDSRSAPQGAYEETCDILLGLPSRISPFTPINQSLPGSSKVSADCEAALYTDNVEALPLKDILKSQPPNVTNTDVEEEAMSPLKSPGKDVPSVPILIENSSQIHAQKEIEDVAACRSELESTPITQSPELDVSLPIASDTVMDTHGGSLQISTRLTRPVALTGGSVSMLRKKIIMDIMQMCGGIYTGHKELVGPFITAWSRQGKPGKPDSKTVYAAFRSLVQSGKLRELKFSFQTPEGLMVTKSMITLTDISPTDPRVAEMQQVMRSCHPSPYIPEAVERLGEVRKLPEYPSRFGTSRATADLEVDNELQVRLQHKPFYVTRLERSRIAAERSRQVREAKMETIKARLERQIERARFWNRSKLSRASGGTERLTSIRRPLARLNKDLPTGFDVGTPHFDLADVDLDFTYISSEVDSREEERAGKNEEVSSMIHKRKHGLSDGYETGENAHASREGKHKKRRLAGRCPTIQGPKRSAHTLRQISTMMDPGQSFHAATGTFSVTFSGFKNLNRKTNRVSDATFFNEGTTNFAIEANNILKWELAAGGFIYPVDRERSFINYQLLQPLVTPAETEYVIDPNFEITLIDRSGRKVSEPSHGSSIKKVRILDKALDTEATSARPPLPKKSHKRKRADPTLKTRRLTALGEANALADFNTVERVTDPNTNGARPAKIRKVRGPHKQPPMTRDEEERLLAAVVAIRTLTGGVEKNPDWVLIARLFQPTYSQMFIQKKWSQVLQRYRIQMDQIQANFQTKFAKAYEDNTIPTIDFDHLEDYDWEWLVGWTLDNVDTSWDSLQHLPSERWELDLLFDITASPDADMSEYFGIDSTVTMQRREAVLNRIPYVYPTELSRPPSSNASAQEVAIAKTWIRANVITSAASYNPDLARAKLSALSESSVDVALQEMLSARLLSQSNKGRLVPGRNYDVSEYFLGRLRKKLDVAQFRRAAAFKRRLDERLGEHTSVVIPYEATNGDMMAVLNMLASGRITVKAKNPPMEKFGLTDGGYRTRRMDKSRLNFDVEIQRAPSYMTGNPIAPVPLPPCQHLDDPMAKIPLWYDIHGQFIPIMWDMLLAATMSTLAMRSNVNAAEIERSVGPSAEQWELELILGWMVQAGAATKAGQGRYTVAEWWWMCFDNDEWVKRSEGNVVPPQG